MKTANLMPVGGTPAMRPEPPRPEPSPQAGRRLQVPVMIAAVLLVVAVTATQGMWTGRWATQADPAALNRAARALEDSFPVAFGDWEWDKDAPMKSDAKTLERAGAVGHVARTYRNARTKVVITTFVVCATPYHASAHTPDRCYPGAGFEIAEAEHRLAVPLSDGREAEAFTGTFRKDGQTLRVFWTYGLKNRWIAPQLARITLQNEGVDAVYKLYAIIDETHLRNAQSIDSCTNFLATLLPALDKAVADSANRAAADAAVPAAAAAPAVPDKAAAAAAR